MWIFHLLFIPTYVACTKNNKIPYQDNGMHFDYNKFKLNLDARIQNKNQYNVLITDNSTVILKQFWKNTGLCPPDPHQESFKFLLSTDMKLNLFHIGSLPFKGITHVRIHWLLDLVRIRIYPDFSISYNFNNLDELVFVLWKNDLYLGFELMGNPSNYFTDFENATQVYMWRDLITATSNHYINLYSIDFVRKWNFETWNEPDHHDFDKLNFTVKGFLNYYDACSEGLKLSDIRLKFGGPGGSCRIPTKGHSPICWALLEHCMKGKNYFTGEIGNRIDFISFHKKGNASSLYILDEEKETIEYMKNIIRIPDSIPFFNDEADPIKNWAYPRIWRADTTYAAMVVKIILSHIVEYYSKNETNTHFNLLSNDNAFLSYYPYQFTERTLLARFQINNTYPKYVEFVKKPIYAVFGLIGQLCPNILHTDVYRQGKKINTISDFGVIATYCLSKRKQVVIVMYNSADSILSNLTFSINLSLNISALNISNGRWAMFEINNINTNPYLVWEKFGKPMYPKTKQFSFIKDHEQPQIKGPWNIKNFPPWKFHLQLLNPGIAMINICKNPIKIKKVENIRFFQIGNNTIQISWTDKYNFCIFTYFVQYSTYYYGPYIKLNQKNIIFPSYWHSCDQNYSNCSVLGFYRIYAVDYWNIRGPYTVPVKFSVHI